jgi:hypothetical protein
MAKKIIIPALFFILAVSAATAQHTQTNTSVTLNTFGAGINYESAWGQRGSIIARAGLIVPVMGNNWVGDFNYSLNPEVGVEARLYYSLDNRAKKGKNTGLNSADYLSMDCRYIFGPIASDIHDFWGNHYDENLRGLLISPNWGMRRVYGGHWVFEFSPGLNFFVEPALVTITPRANFKFGFVF